MKKIQVLIILLISSCTSSSKVTSRKAKENQLLTKAFLDVIHELFTRPKIEFETLIFEKVSPHVYEVLDGLEDGGFVTNHKRYSFNQNYRVLKPIVIFCESLEKVKEFFTQYLLGGISIAKHYRFLFYVEKPFNVTQIGTKKLNSYRGSINWYSYFIIKDKNEIHLKTLRWFTDFKCGKEQVITLNSFDLKLQKWKTSLRIRDNYETYHGCTINFSSQIFRIYMVDAIFEYPIVKTLLPDKLVEIFFEIGKMRDEIENDFTQIFAQKGNFTIKRSDTNTEKDMELLTSYLLFVDYFHFSANFFQEEYMLITTPAEPYDSFEKIVLPFDFTTWICLIVTFTFYFAVIFLVNRTSKTMQNIVFGARVQSPSLNVVGAFFGISQKEVPRNNFTRFTLILFVFFCLIFRTAYQGVFFTMITTNMHKHPPQTINEIMDLNYTVFSLHTDDDDDILLPQVLEWTKNFKNAKLEPIGIDLSQEPYIGMFDPHANIAITLDEDSYKILESVFDKVPRKISIELFTNVKGIGVHMNNHAFRLLEKVMMYLVQSGIPQHIRKSIFNVRFKYSTNPVKIPSEFINIITSPKVFSVQDLKFGFVIWLVSILVASTAFLLELINGYGKECLRNCLGLYYFIKLLKVQRGY